MLRPTLVQNIAKQLKFLLTNFRTTLHPVKFNKKALGIITAKPFLLNYS